MPIPKHPHLLSVVFDLDAAIHQGKTKKQLLTDTEQGSSSPHRSQSQYPAENTTKIIGTKQPRKRLAAVIRQKCI